MRISVYLRVPRGQSEHGRERAGDEAGRWAGPDSWAWQTVWAFSLKVKTLCCSALGSGHVHTLTRGCGVGVWPAEVAKDRAGKGLPTRPLTVGDASLPLTSCSSPSTSLCLSNAQPPTQPGPRPLWPRSDSLQAAVPAPEPGTLWPGERPDAQLWARVPIAAPSATHLAWCPTRKGKHEQFVSFALAIYHTIGPCCSIKKLNVFK